MDEGELRRRVAEILEAEERSPTDWTRVDELCATLVEQLPEAKHPYPHVLHHFVADVDIRQRDNAYALYQRNLIRRFVETGEMVHDEPSTRMPAWSCALLVAIPIALLLWWLL
jgi:hypothetical protein